jgi:hypothetical protein
LKALFSAKTDRLFRSGRIAARLHNEDADARDTVHYNSAEQAGGSMPQDRPAL